MLCRLAAVVGLLVLAGCATPRAGHLYDSLELSGYYNRQASFDSSTTVMDRTWSPVTTELRQGGDGGGVALKLIFKYDREPKACSHEHEH